MQQFPLRMGDDVYDSKHPYDPYGWKHLMEMSACQPHFLFDKLLITRPEKMDQNQVPSLKAKISFWK